LYECLEIEVGMQCVEKRLTKVHNRSLQVGGSLTRVIKRGQIIPEQEGNKIKINAYISCHLQHKAFLECLKILKCQKYIYLDGQIVVYLGSKFLYRDRHNEAQSPKFWHSFYNGNMICAKPKT
jgi:hypothetical protein